MDRYFADYARNNFAEGNKVIAVPDPVPVSLDKLPADARRMSPDRVGFLLFGDLSERKGILVTLDALFHLPHDLAARCHVRFAGRVAPTIREEFYTRVKRMESIGNPTRIEVVDRYLDDDEIPPMVVEADIILAPYVRHIGSSGSLYWAAAGRKPVIAQDYGLIGRETRQFGLGLTADTRFSASLAEAIATAIRTNGQGLAQHEGQTLYIEGHTRMDFAAALIKGLSASLRI